MGIRIGYKIVNGNGKELELTMWEWQGMGFYNKDWKKRYQCILQPPVFYTVLGGFTYR